jgi:hypothetical protein
LDVNFSSARFAYRSGGSYGAMMGKTNSFSQDVVDHYAAEQGERTATQSQTDKCEMSGSTFLINVNWAERQWNAAGRSGQRER